MEFAINKHLIKRFQDRYSTAMAILKRVRNSRDRFELFFEVNSDEISEELLDLYEFLKQDCKCYGEYRNHICHSLWATNGSRDDELLLIDLKQEQQLDVAYTFHNKNISSFREGDILHEMQKHVESILTLSHIDLIQIDRLGSHLMGAIHSFGYICVGSAAQKEHSMQILRDNPYTSHCFEEKGRG